MRIENRPHARGAAKINWQQDRKARTVRSQLQGATVIGFYHDLDCLQSQGSRLKAL
jgi:hypothetical protein